jgi:hypothetical protein
MAGEDAIVIRQRLVSLRAEHRELHEQIERLSEGPYVDELEVRRLKRRKLLVKDMIRKLEDDLIPDLDA